MQTLFFNQFDVWMTAQCKKWRSEQWTNEWIVQKEASINYGGTYQIFRCESEIKQEGTKLPRETEPAVE